MGLVPYDINRELVALLRADGYTSMDELLKHLGLSEPRGVYVVRVEQNSPAERAGIQEGDVIVEFSGRRVYGQSDMFFKVAEVEPGTTVTLKVLRDKREREFQLALAERPPRNLYERPRRR
jgi:serine protease Do